LEKRDFAGMTRWVRRISDRDVAFDASSIQDLDRWIDELEKTGLHLVFSSGTSGRMSFVPRHDETWDAFMAVPYLYVPALLAHRGIIPRGKKILLHLLAKHTAPATFLRTVQKLALRDFDGFFLNFSGGNQGIQLVGRETAKLTRSACFLYERAMSPAAIRAII